MSTNKKKRNIGLGYVLIALNDAFFWYAPWLLFVYQFIDIREATILQMIGVVTRAIAEIPTGALADLIGKKKTLTIAFFLTAIGEITMAFSTGFSFFVVSYIILSLGYSFYSGTIDAFMYDTLVEAKSESDYPSILSKSNAFTNLATAVATIIGGFLFRYWGGLPFLITGLTKLAGFVITFFISEPAVDTTAFSVSNFLKQTASGLNHLFSKKLIKWTALIVLLGSFNTIAYEILDDAAVVDWGYNATGISLLYTTVIVISIPSSFLYEKFAKKIKPVVLASGGILFLALNYLFSPFINTFVWTLFFLMRVVYSPIKKAAITYIINSNVASNIRATTLSTYELIIRIPFVVFGALIGTLMKEEGIRQFSLMFSSGLLSMFAIYLLILLLKKTQKRPIY